MGYASARPRSARRAWFDPPGLAAWYPLASGQLERHGVVLDAGAGEEVWADLGHRRALACQVRQQPAVPLHRYTGLLAPSAADGGIGDVAERRLMKREPGAAAAR